jgi:hypothetical protein
VNLYAQLRPLNLLERKHITLKKGDLKVEFIDNTSFGPLHKKGYNGLASLVHLRDARNIFVPEYAGFNLEHIFGGDSLQQLFEPRLHPMALFQKSDDQVLLYQSSTPDSKVESLTQFRLVEPYYIDVTFQCIIHDSAFFKHNYAGFFWASYINQPDDKTIYFRGKSNFDENQSWIQAYSKEHGVASTHRSSSKDRDFYFAENFNAKLANHFSDFTYEAPFFYGRFSDMVLAYLFDSDQVIRFSQSPTGGGSANPAWDFQWMIPEPQIGQIYSFETRLIYKPFVSSRDIEEEFENWLKNH